MRFLVNYKKIIMFPWKSKGLLFCLSQTIAVTLLIIGIRIFTDGMWLFGLPSLSEIQSVSIAYPALTEETKNSSDPEKIELALKLTGFLKYEIGKTPDPAEQPVITITYHLKDGTDQTISASDSVVWWNGKSHVIRDKKTFIHLTEGIFFLEDLNGS